jgi:hypothetical protein
MLYHHVTAEVEGNILKRVDCQHCGHTFMYQMQRKGTGTDVVPSILGFRLLEEKASQEAASNLEKSLVKDFDPVPCPQCSRYQPSMLARVRWSHRHWLVSLAKGLGILTLIFLGVYLFDALSSSYTATVRARMAWTLPAMIALGVATLLVAVTKLIISWRYDPNNTAEALQRLELARKRMVPAELPKN